MRWFVRLLVGYSRMKCILSICALLSLSTVVFGQQPTVDARRLPPTAARPDSTGQQLSRLLRTADELERAGQPRQAATVRQEADWERRSLLRRLEDLQAEAQQLRAATGSDRQILVHVQILEVSLSKAQSLGFDMSKLTGQSSSPPGVLIQEAIVARITLSTMPGKQQQLVESLRKDNLAKILAEPTLVTTSGRPASLNSGGQFALPKPEGPDSGAKEYQEYGTRVDLTADLLGEQKVRLALHCRTSELDLEHTVSVGKAILPGLRVLEFQTTTELRDDQTLVLAGPIQVCKETAETGIPVVGSLPWLVPVFKNAGTKNIETQVFLLVRPAILAPSVVAALDAGNNAGVYHASPASPVIRPTAGSNVPLVTAHPSTASNVRR